MLNWGMKITALPDPLVFVDTETTGTNPKRDRVIELGIIRVESGKIVSKIDTLVNPHTHLPPEIFNITGIHPTHLLSAPDFNDIEAEVRELCEGAVFIAHNARFDYAFIKHEFIRSDARFSAKVACSVKIARRLFPGLPSYSLGHLINYFGFSPSQRHRAYADAEVLFDLYKLALLKFGEEKVAEVFQSILKSSSLPSHLPYEMIEDLPEGSGIYTFYGDDSLPLYIGKSVNIKDRVKGHFSSDYQNTSDLTMSSQIKKVEAMETAGEIGALIRESDAIKALMPVYNRQLRRRHDLVAALITKTSEYNKISIKNLNTVSDEELGNIMAVFKSPKNAKDKLYELVKTYNLCPIKLGLEKGGHCFMSQIGVCFGACSGTEDKDLYNKRLEYAFTKTKIKSWPFNSVVVLKEQNEKGLIELHFIDKWKYLGSAVYSIRLPDEPKVEKYTPRFDWDIYKILAKAVLTNKTVHEMTEEERNLFFNV